MPFEGVRVLSRERLAEVQQLLNHIVSLEPVDVTTPHPPEVKILRGFSYVHLYAALEKSINKVVQLTLRLIASHNTPAKDYKLSFGSVAARGRLQAFKGCRYKAYNDNASSIFSSLESNEIMNIDEFQFSDVLMNVWTNSILEVFNSFGISSFVVEPRVRTTIDELVENRNKVAHGRESALVAGERHRSKILRDKFSIVTSLIDSVIAHLEDFYNTRAFLRVN
ncbi:MAE_28990/MAE_18760 family HEPN-like nuclease [Pseudomonas sp. Irchel s3b5]|uniref:MAE_28990/MAE_18760 family HEPN-like nuclease n=1 Tax=Pseudomonas sp. Irchel s3b5 TaxID=2009077 RepID=UPI00117A91F9|nr:MAE_28990/MAE_18760 family HEPN-like nuclease [Pseudomonas sp. Irchel s3b5]